MENRKYTEAAPEILSGEVIDAIIEQDDTFTFICTSGKRFIFLVDSDKTKYCRVVGDTRNLVGVPILSASVHRDSNLWAIYMFSTRKGDVKIEWFGVSKGRDTNVPHFFKAT
jgi:hypothetical protein